MCRGGIEVFVIATTDSDFTSLASRLRMRGYTAIGMGRGKAAESFKRSFDEYHEVDGQAGASADRLPTAKVLPLRQAGIRPYIIQALAVLEVQPGEWVDVGRLSAAIRQQHPVFSPKIFGSAKFSTVLRECGFLDIQMKNGKLMQARLVMHGAKAQQGTGG